MAQFDYYANTDKDTNKTYPYIVDVQDALLNELNSRVVIPLTPLSNLETSYPKNLCPKITIEGKEYSLLTHQMSSISRRALSNYEGSLTHNRTEIISAIDFRITGI
jgi:toxin CcdB